MRQLPLKNRATSTVLVIIAMLFAAAAGLAQQTALDRYVAKPDPAYSWKLAGTAQSAGYKSFILELTSQTWRSAAEVDRPVWKHWLTIVRPDKLAFNTALLYIGGGSNKDQVPTEPSARIASIAADTGTVAAELGMVPNQPLFFEDSK